MDLSNIISYNLQSPITSMPKKVKLRDDRKYLGVTITSKNYREVLEKEGRDGINFHNKHLKAYLQGKKMFQAGYQKDKEGKLIKDFSGRPIPAMFEVKQELTLNKITNE